MSQSRLSLIDPSTAQALAQSFLEARRLKHLDFTMTAPQGGEGGAGEGGAGGSAGGAGGTGAPSGEPAAGSGGSTDGGDPQKKISALEEEKDRHFQARKAAEEELQKYKKAEEDRTRASQDELTNTKQDLEKAQQTIEQLTSALDQALIDNAFLTENTYKWQNPSRVLKLVDRDAVTIKDGQVVGVKEALDTLAKSDPYLLKTEDPAEGSGAGGKSATGPGTNGKGNNGNGQFSREDLAKKYPALRR